MKVKFILLSIIALSSCKEKPQNKQVHDIPKSILVADYSSKRTAASGKQTDSLNVADEIADQTVKYYVVVTDTGNSYYSLKEKMQAISQNLNIPIDTMGRFYNKKKNIIQLPDNDSDEIYAGDYYPRRYPSNFLSLEYMNLYKRGSSKSTIALVAGIYEKKSSADSALSVLKSSQKNTFAILSPIYIGCIH